MSDKFTKRRLHSSTLTMVVSLSLVLFMLGLLGLIVLNAKKLSDHMKENIAFQLILTDTVISRQAEDFQRVLKQYPYVKDAHFVHKEIAARQLKADLGEDFIGFLGYNPLKSTITVHLNAAYTHPDSLRFVEKEFLNNPMIREVSYQRSLVEMVNQNVQKIGLVILVFSGLLMVIALALINNTIRLSIYSKRFLIKTMQLVGATQGFIRKPFIWAGIRHGIVAAVVAIALLVGLIYLSSRQMPELLMLQDERLLATLFGVVVLLGVIISWISTHLAVRKYLRSNTDDLYY